MLHIIIIAVALAKAKSNRDLSVLTHSQSSSLLIVVDHYEYVINIEGSDFYIDQLGG